VIEMTATPTAGSNVLWHVSAQALQREDMIKLPIVLKEHLHGWRDAVRDAMLSRERLERWRCKSPITSGRCCCSRPSRRNGEATVEALLRT
jgi:type III restriction enzyme